jgi:uncharacterized protein with GYD domain
MPTYILLLTLTPEGRERVLSDPDTLLRAEREVHVPDVTCMGIYGVIGEYDFVTWLEAPDNETAARFSLAMGVRAGAHVTTLPAIPLGEFRSAPHRVAAAEAEPDPLDNPVEVTGNVPFDLDGEVDLGRG